MDALTVDYARRPTHHAMAGGVFHLYSGALGLLMSSAFWLDITRPHDPNQWIDALLMLAFIILTLLYSRARAKYVYPRLGYVTPQYRPAWQTAILLAVICTVSVAVALYLADANINLSVISNGAVSFSATSGRCLALLFTGLISAAVYATYAWNLRQVLYLRFAAVYILAAVVLSLLNISYALAAALFITIISLMYLMAGAFEFRDLLRLPAIDTALEATL